MQKTKKEHLLKGAPISRGIAVGQAFLFKLIDDAPPEFVVSPDDIDHEISRYHKAIEYAREDILALQKKLKKENIDEGAEILSTHLHIMEDPLLTVAVEGEIRRTRKNAEFVFNELIRSYHSKFQIIKDPFFRERFKDIQDIARRVMAYLRESVRVSLADISPGSIVFAEDLTATDTAEVKRSDVAAFVTETGGDTSHAAIVAKAKGIPFVTNVSLHDLELDKESIIIVDGMTGNVIINPTADTLKKYTRLQATLNSHMTNLDKRLNLPAETYDGYQIRLSANLDMVNELDLLREHGSHGVGLFRSEYIFLASSEFPHEEDQYEIYKRVVEKLEGMPIVIRTFDVGGDKQILGFDTIKKRNPFLGSRALRFFLKEKGIFKVQLRAILRAAVHGDVSVMFPMVSSYSELMEAKALLREAEQELDNAGTARAKNIRVGCMIEVPSAAIIADLLAKQCDFLSIGTNDLVQYSLAIDRSSQAMHGYYAATDPSIIRLIKMIVTHANQQGIPVSVCGEMASDPRLTSLLLGLGVHELSLPAIYIPTIKNAIRSSSIVAASHLAEKALKLNTAQEILALLTEEYRKNVPEDYIFLN